MSSGKLSGFSDIAKQAMMQPQESMLEVKDQKKQALYRYPKRNLLPGKPDSVNAFIRCVADQ